MTDLNIELVQQKLYAAIAEASGAQQQAFRLRPSNIGYCPLRLQFDLEQAAEGGGREARDPRSMWPPFQGIVLEDLMCELLRIAGAELIRPPHDSDLWAKNLAPDPETGFEPHLDGLIRWPDVGIDEWHILELKDLRSEAQIGLFTSGLYNDRAYWYQSVSYLMTSPLAIKNYAEFERSQWKGFGELNVNMETFPWITLAEEGLVPSGIFFMSCAKDPSTTKRDMSGRIKVPQYESNPPAKGLKPEQMEMIAKRIGLRATMDRFAGNTDFYMEIVDRADESVQETWLDIQNVRRQVLMSPRAEALYDITVPDDKLPDECRWYCPWLEKHRMGGSPNPVVLSAALEAAMQATGTLEE